MMLMVGAMAFATTVLMPQFLQTILGYTAENAGMVLSAAAVLLLFELPVVGRLTSVFQLRRLIAFGWFMLAIGMYISVRGFDQQMSFGHATVLRIFQYLPLGFVFVPATTAAYIGIRQEKSNAVAGLVNFTRNIGSSIGTSAVTTIIARRSQFHQVALADHINPGNPQFQAALNGLTDRLAHAGLSLHEAQRQAMARLYAGLQAQAATLSYIDTYWVLCICCSCMFFFSFLLVKNDPRPGSTVSLH